MTTEIFVVEVSSSKNVSKAETKQNNEALVIIIGLSVAHVFIMTNVFSVFIANTGFGFLYSSELRNVMTGTNLRLQFYSQDWCV